MDFISTKNYYVYKIKRLWIKIFSYKLSIQEIDQNLFSTDDN